MNLHIYNKETHSISWLWAIVGLFITIGAFQYNTNFGVFFALIGLGDYFIPKYLDNTKESHKKENTEKNKSWSKKQLILTSIIIIFGIGFIIGFSDSMSKTKCEPFVNKQLPNTFIFNENYILNNTWNDGTKIKTLKNYNIVKPDDIVPMIDYGYFEFNQGSKPGENVNNYYISNSAIITTSQIGEINRKESPFYFEYEKESETTNSGVIIPNIRFKILVKEYEIKKIDEQYYFKVLKYDIDKCENI